MGPARWFLLGVAAAVPLVAGCGGPSPASAPRSSATLSLPAPTSAGPSPAPGASGDAGGPLALGVAAVVDDGSGDVDRVTVVSVTTHTAGAAGHPPPTHGVYVVASVRFEETAGTDQVSGGSFQVADGSATYAAMGGPQDRSGYAPTVVAGTVSPGRPLVGTIVFDVPAADGIIQYAPATAPLAAWRF